MSPLLIRCVSEECANRGQLARCRSSAQPIAASMGKKRTKLRRTKRKELLATNQLTAMSAKEFNQSMSSRNIGAHRMH